MINRHSIVLGVEIGVRLAFLVPPDKQEKATQAVLEQAQLLALAWAA
jgi:hypothetical protein